MTTKSKKVIEYPTEELLLMVTKELRRTGVLSDKEQLSDYSPGYIKGVGAVIQFIVEENKPK